MNRGNGRDGASQGAGRPGSLDESRQWEEFGKWIAERREECGLRRRDAARKAKISEAAWRDLETGRKEAIGGIRLLPNPSRDVLSRVATTLNVSLEELMSRVGRRDRDRRSRGRSLGGDDAEDSPMELKLRRLSDRDQLLVERIVDSMLEIEET